MLSLARWVAAVPYLEDAALNRRRSDVWTRSADFLALAAGDAEEHAHLLAGYFLALGQQVRGCVVEREGGERTCKPAWVGGP
jgi:coiled-coil and C2 domain-containing protein 2A